MIYLDNAATTRPSKTAIEKANIFNEEMFFNPSTLYSGGLNCAREIKKAKENILSCIGAFNHELVFTSCGTESDNTAIFCSVKRGVFVTDKGEHSAVYKSFLELKNKGLTVEFIDLNPDGTVDTNKLYKFVKENRVDFVSILHVNNETGGINDINTIAKNLKLINPKLIFHSDGVQAFGKIPYKISKDIDFYSISAHKINALKGVGALFRKKSVNLSAYIHGGGQENGLRSGTENVFGIKVFEYATLDHYNNLRSNFDKVLSIKKYFIDNLKKDLFRIISSGNSSPYILTVSAVGLRGEVVMHSLELEGIIIGNGSACSSKNRYSRVVGACGYENDVLDGVIRLSFSHENTIEEAKIAVEKINETAEKLKGIMQQ